MSVPTPSLLKTNLKQLRLPTMSVEFEKLGREATAANEDYEQYLLRLTELELSARASNAVASRIRTAGFKVLKDLDALDFTAVAHLSKPKILELARCQWPLALKLSATKAHRNSGSGARKGTESGQIGH